MYCCLHCCCHCCFSCCTFCGTECWKENSFFTRNLFFLSCSLEISEKIHKKKARLIWEIWDKLYFYYNEVLSFSRVTLVVPFFPNYTFGVSVMEKAQQNFRMKLFVSWTFHLNENFKMNEHEKFINESL